MLRQLVSLKARRERSIRAALHALSRRERALLAQFDEIRVELAGLRERWRERCDIVDVLDQEALRDLKVELGDYYLAERRFLERIDAVNRLLEEVRIERDRQNRLLQKAVIAQDKFMTLLE
ncbi:hypothetical protein [Trinickia symbiotica]|uniref:hypothetical protein n=1 Tax=Trinickia symbiotica TaxID=863227 RepID=UPI000D150C90|nr:hypothetical protein [Trinickia symbiotica]